jgi:hypothetical protein
MSIEITVHYDISKRLLVTKLLKKDKTKYEEGYGVVHSLIHS